MIVNMNLLVTRRWR